MPRFDPVRDAERSLAVVAPDIARLLVGVDPALVPARGSKTMLWACPVDGSGHEPYEGTPNAMTAPSKRDNQCPQCWSEVHSLAYNYPHLARLIVLRDPFSIAAKSSRQVRWRCGVEGSGHPTYERPVYAMTKAHGDPGSVPCPACRREGTANAA